MTEAEWLACDKRPDTMLHLVRGRVSDRKLRLYACACVRYVWPHLLAEERGRELLGLMERHADGLVTRDELVAAARPAWEAVGMGFDSSVEGRGREATPEKRAAVVAALAQSSGHGAATYFTYQCWRRGNRQERKELCRLLREVVGNPFRPATLDRGWLTPDVRTLARAAYEERALPAGTLDPQRLTLLADALEDAGCADGQVLGHLRGSGLHVRGCWAVDLVLGKS